MIYAGVGFGSGTKTRSDYPCKAHSRVGSRLTKLDTIQDIGSKVGGECSFKCGRSFKGGHFFCMKSNTSSGLFIISCYVNRAVVIIFEVVEYVFTEHTTTRGV